MLADEWDFLGLARRINDCRVIHIAVEGRIRTTYRINHNEVEIFCLQFFKAVFDVILGFRGEAHEHLAILVAAEFLENIDRGLEVESEIGSLLFDLLSSYRLRPEVEGRR